MTYEELVREFAARTSAPEETVRALLDLEARLVEHGHVTGDELVNALLHHSPPHDAAAPDPRAPQLVDELIERAQGHALGLDFLRKGHLGSVAATFHAHAFTVLAARERLG